MNGDIESIERQCYPDYQCVTAIVNIYPDYQYVTAIDNIYPDYQCVTAIDNIYQVVYVLHTAFIDVLYS